MSVTFYKFSLIHGSLIFVAESRISSIPHLSRAKQYSLWTYDKENACFQKSGAFLQIVLVLNFDLKSAQKNLLRVER